MRAQRIWLLILNVAFNLVMGFILPVNMIFIHKNLHESLVTAGFALMVYSAFMMVGNALGGIMFDRFSRRGTLYTGYGISIISLLGMSFHHVWPSYAVMLFILGFGMGLIYTAVNAYTAFVAEQMSGNSRVVFNNMYLASNIGIAIGSTAVGYIFKWSIFFTFFIPMLLFVISTIILFSKANLLDHVSQRGDSDTEVTDYNSSEVDPRVEIGSRRFNLNIFIICASIFIVWLGYSQWDSNMSAYMLNQGYTTREYGLVFTINAGSLLIIQPVMNRVISKIFKLLKYQIFIGTIIMGSSFLLLPEARTYSAFIISMLVLTVGESMVFPTIPALLSKMSTKRNRGTFQSFYSIFGSLGRAVGPYAGSLVITALSFSNLFIGITVSMIIVAVAMIGVKELA
ncbi:MFS transporter [Companilactobacillus alimentarius]|uniref:MFS transporter n=1 Tax=Companilactobacillus alimentarius DSM 20249 TaxID=1423720 RepID=A0A2K9HM66_9LACO|nr:MFS transporter [Companilactobacillus alimentarius]AUI72205.1 MFS transporter [Companilactobacillus alimentarius DSM 20249]KRK77084.1 major facilitator superfamily permease [Companilactobacillus alimentarius DSM 20249]MDT6952774.1 MFS transporter [Companilactobacillus alimentarius]GEO45987.1 MFS transporter [Companilactobacillus alimentarius]